MYRTLMNILAAFAFIGFLFVPVGSHLYARGGHHSGGHHGDRHHGDMHHDMHGDHHWNGHHWEGYSTSYSYPTDPNYYPSNNYYYLQNPNPSVPSNTSNHTNLQR